MSRNDWGIILAPCVGLALAWTALLSHWASQPNQQRRQPYASAQRYQTAPGDGFAAYPVEDANACYRAKSHDSADLCAQWRAAVAAEKAANAAVWSNLLSILGATISLLGLILLLRSLGQTDRSIGYTRDANEISRATARQDLRAYVSLKESEETMLTNAEDRPLAYTFKVVWQNTGSTPARNCLTGIWHHMLDGDLPDNADYLLINPNGPRSNMGPGLILESNVTVSVAELAGRRLYIYAMIEYDDVFLDTPRHRTEVCYEPLIDANDVIYGSVHRGQFNRMDEDCHQQPTRNRKNHTSVLD